MSDSETPVSMSPISILCRILSFASLLGGIIIPKMMIPAGAASQSALVLIFSTGFGLSMVASGVIGSIIFWWMARIEEHLRGLSI